MTKFTFTSGMKVNAFWHAKQAIRRTWMWIKRHRLTIWESAYNEGHKDGCSEGYCNGYVVGWNDMKHGNECEFNPSDMDD